MNEDQLTQFQEAPRPEFVAALYQRINQPMNAQTQVQTMRRAGLAFAAISLLLAIAFLSYPPTRALARNLLMQIGVFSVTTQPPAEGLPTAVPPDASSKTVSASSSAEASQAAGFSVFSPAALPDGYQTGGPFYINPNGTGKVVTSTFTQASSGKFILINQYRAGEGDAFTDYITGAEVLAEVNIRGQQGAWISGRRMTNPVDLAAGSNLLETNWLLWEEDGVNFTIITDGLSLEETLAFAESLK